MKLDIPFQNIPYIAPQVPSNLNRASLALCPVKYFENPLAYIADIIGFNAIVVG